MRSIGAKLITVIAASIVLVSGYVAFSVYSIHADHILERTQIASRLAFQFDLAIREYMSHEVRPRVSKLVGDDEFVPETMSSSYATRAIFDKVREEFPRYILKFSSRNPRNPRNLAGPAEGEVLDYFEAHPEEDLWDGEIEIEGRRYLGYFRARRAEPSCLACHGLPEDAPEELLNRYGRTAGFFTEVGDVIGVDTVAIPIGAIGAAIFAESKRNIVFILLALAGCLGAIVFALHRIVVTRIADITNHISQATANNDYSGLEQYRTRGNDEIDLLTKSFNIMAGRLRKFYGTLEEDVRERTVRLEAANEKLSETVEMHKKAEKALKKSEGDLKRTSDFYRTILDSMHDAVAIVDVHSLKIVSVNGVFGALYGRDRDDLLERTCCEAVHGRIERCSVGSKMSCPLEETLLNGGYAVVDQVHNTRERTGVPVEVSTSPIMDDQGRIVQVVLVVRDVTARRTAEESLEEARREAEKANRAKSQFLANTSHEIRTPLNGIIGMVEVAMDTEVSDDQRPIFNTIANEAGALLAVVDDVLDFSKIEAGRLDLEKVDFNLHHLMEDLANGVALQAEKKGLEFNSYIAPDLPTQVTGDPGRLRQIILNLSSNALKFTDEGEILIRAEVEEIRERDMTVRITVRDTGVGIPADKQKDILDSFTQADGSTTRKYGGTGLGMAIAQQLVALMGGEMTLESEEGHGSNFHVAVVLGRAGETEQTGLKGNVDLREKVILVVDDSRTSRSILQSYLGLWGCRTFEAGGGREALATLAALEKENRHPDLLMTDYRMGEIDGFSLAEKVRKKPFYDKMPIILLTTMGSLGDGKRCKEIGIQGYLTKPLGKDELQSAIVAVLQIPVAREREEKRRTLISRHTIAEGKPGAKPSILLVEDYPTIQKILLAHLKEGGCAVDLATNGLEAVEAFKRKPYDLVFMDVQMPEMDGFDATKAMRAFEEDQHGGAAGGQVPIVAVTARTTKGDQKRCRDVGMNDYIAKPVKRKALLEMVRKWTGGTVTSALHPEGEGSKALPQPLLFDEVMDEFQGREEILLGAIDRFLKDLKDQMGVMEESLANGDLQAISAEAHSIKGAARFLSAEPLAEAAQSLEKAGREAAGETALEALKRLAVETARLEEFIKARKRERHG